MNFKLKTLRKLKYFLSENIVFFKEIVLNAFENFIFFILRILQIFIMSRILIMFVFLEFCNL